MKIWRFVTLLLIALGLTMGMAHVLELQPKMAYDGAMYAAVNSTLYALFGTVGGAVQVGALLAAALLAFWVRGRDSFWMTLAGTLALTLSLALWSVLVLPVNLEWACVMQARPEAVPDSYLALRDRWEYGHVAAFFAWLLGFGLHLGAILSEIKAPHPRPSEELISLHAQERAEARVR